MPGGTQIKSFLLVYGAVKTTISDQEVVWVYGKGHERVSFCVGRCVLREWVVGEGGLDGYLGEQDCRRASRSALKDFTDDALTISAGSLFQNRTARMVKANW